MESTESFSKPKAEKHFAREVRWDFFHFVNMAPLNVFAVFIQGYKSGEVHLPVAAKNMITFLLFEEKTP